MAQMKVFAGRSNRPLAERICRRLDCRLGKMEIAQFADGEIKPHVLENVRGVDVFIVQSTEPPAENLFELLTIIDAMKRASAERITAVIPYYGYARQDRKDEPRVPITAKLIADLLTVAGASRILALELHAEQIQGYFTIPVDHLYSAPVLIDYFRRQKIPNLVVVSPDVGRVRRARAFASRLGKDIPLAIIDKRRIGKNLVRAVNVIGDVRGKTALIFDDMIDTGGTILDAIAALKRNGASRILVTATHGVLSKGASEKLYRSPIEQIVLTDSLNLGPERLNSKTKVLSVAKLLATAMIRTHRSQSVSSLFV
jgi:ribose-phosphate pyrophosphokinase